ncbi:MAG TPA: STAS domain-containing protein [Opitutales bacterium]|nr:STAS domain-containing protein [Opitutales bacterium]
MDNGAALLTLSGRLDANTSDCFFEAVCKEVAGGRANVRVDASAVPYISSAGLRAMLQSHRKTASAGGSFRIVRASPFVSQTISMSGLDQLLGDE